MALWTSQPGYRMFSDENADSVYSPVPEKYQRMSRDKNAGMTLRPRIPFRNLNIISNFSTYASLKSGRDNMSKVKGQVNNASIREKMGVALDLVSQKIVGKSKKKSSKPQKMSPASLCYRDRIKSSPLTPSNPFNSTPNLRRSPRLSAIGSPDTPLSWTAKKTPLKRKRNPKKDSFINHLESVQSGIKELNANGSKMNRALQYVRDRSPANKKQRFHERPTEDKVSIKPNEKKQEKVPTIRRGKMGRSVSKVSIKSRTLASNFSRSASILSAHVQGKPTYQSVETIPAKRRVHGERNYSLEK